MEIIIIERKGANLTHSRSNPTSEQLRCGTNLTVWHPDMDLDPSAHRSASNRLKRAPAVVRRAIGTAATARGRAAAKAAKIMDCTLEPVGFKDVAAAVGFGRIDVEVVDGVGVEGLFALASEDMVEARRLGQAEYAVSRKVVSESCLIGDKGSLDKN